MVVLSPSFEDRNCPIRRNHLPKAGKLDLVLESNRQNCLLPNQITEFVCMVQVFSVSIILRYGLRLEPESFWVSLGGTVLELLSFGVLNRKRRTLFLCDKTALSAVQWVFKLPGINFNKTGSYFTSEEEEEISYQFFSETDQDLFKGSPEKERPKSRVGE